LGIGFLRTCLAVTPLDVGKQALEERVELAAGPLASAIQHRHPLDLVAVEEDLARLFGELPDRDIGAESVMFGDGLDDLAEPRIRQRHAPPREDCTFRN